MSDEKKSEKPVAETRKPKRRRLVLWIVLAGVLGLVILVALAPALLSTGPGRRLVLSNVNEKLNGKLDVADWSLGWFSGFRMDEVSLKDSAGQTAAEVGSVSLPATVPALMGGTKTLGTVEANSPRLNVVILPDGRTNLHVIFANFIQPSEGPVKVPFDVSGKIVVSNGEISVKPQGAPTAMNVRDLNAEVNIVSLSQPIELTSTAKLGANGAAMQMRGSVTPVHDGVVAPESLEGSVNMQLTGLELAEFSPLAKTFGAPVDVAGKMNMTLDAQLRGASSVTAKGAVKAAGLEFSGGPLGEDRPKLADASLDFDVASDSKRITVNALRLESPVAKASAEGWIAPSATGALPAGNLKTHVESNLAGVAALMPRTLNLQEGLTVTGGTLTLDGTLSSDAADGLPRFESSMRIEGLAANQNGREVALDAPIRIELAAAQTPAGPRLDRFLMDSPFAHAEGSGTLEKFSMEMTSDLDALTAEAGKFVALNGRSVSGAAKLTLGTTAAAEGARRDVTGLFKITGLTVTGFTPCPIPLGDVSSDFKAVAVLGKVSQPSALEKVSLTFASPVLGASFTADRVIPSFDGGLPVAFENGAITANADIEDISQMVNSCEALGVKLDAAGQISVKAPLKVEKGAIILEPDLQASDLRYTQQGKTFTERMLRVTGHLEAQPDSRTVEARNVAAQTSFGELRVTRALVSDWADPFGKPLSANIEGAVQFEQLLAAAGDFIALPPDTVLKGRADFQFRVTAASAAATNVRATMADLHLERPGLPALKEKEVVLLAAAEIDFPEKRAEVRSLSLTSGLLNLTASGSLSDWAGRMLLDAAGTLTPDWERVAPLVATVVGQPVELKGRRERPFSLRVPLGEKDPRALLRDSRADIGMGMESATLMGIEAGPLDVVLKADSAIASVDVTGGLLEGALDLPLRMDATGEEALLRIPEDAPLLRNVTINDALADAVLARFSPVFARAINTSGVVGLTSRRLSSPLDPLRLTEATADMELALNGVNFRSAGFLGELLSLAGMGETTLMHLPDQTVAVGLEEGRIRQGPMDIQFGGYTMTLSGLMGLDGTLDMTAELPVTPGMVPDKSIYELIKGEKLRVPIKGTVAKPAIGKNILTDNLDKLVRSAGRKLLEKEGGKILERGLEKIFK